MRHQDIDSGSFGLERETLRVDRQGRLAQTPHPFGEDAQITRDFCENQVELITPVCPDIRTAVETLGQLDARARQTLAQQGETLWLYSNPPHFETEDDIPIARFSGDHSNKRSYREALEMRYGKRLMLFSGVHFNFSFSGEQLETWNTEHQDARTFKDALYLHLYRQLTRHSWLVVLLTAASPAYDLSLDGDGLHGTASGQYGSLRNSERGYWNQFVPVLDHTNLHTFTESIREYINKGLLFSASELYLPIRLKPRGVNSLEQLAEGGVDHIELRMFDLNPLTPLGVDAEDLTFAHLLIRYLVQLPGGELTPMQQLQAIQDHQAAALYQPPQSLLVRAKRILLDMMRYFEGNADAMRILERQNQRLNGQRLCQQITSEQIYR